MKCSAWSPRVTTPLCCWAGRGQYDGGAFCDRNFNSREAFDADPMGLPLAVVVLGWRRGACGGWCAVVGAEGAVGGDFGRGDRAVAEGGEEDRISRADGGRDVRPGDGGRV